MAEGKERTLSEVLGRDLVEVMTDQFGRRYIWMLGFGCLDETSELGFVWTHFHFCILPLEAFLNNPGLNGLLCNRMYNGNSRVTHEQIDIFDCMYYYSDADTGEPIPYFVRDPEIPDGYYIV